MTDPTIGTNQCDHGSLSRSCELCEKDAEIAELKGKLERVRELAQEVKRLEDLHMDSQEELAEILREVGHE